MNITDKNYFGQEKVWKILLKIAPPVMFAQLIQALYNIVDSLYIGRYSEDGLTALSIIYPFQLLMIAFAVGTGVGMNTYISSLNGLKKHNEANEVAGIGTFLGLFLWVIFGYGNVPAMGLKGAAIATVIGQIAAATIVGIYGYKKSPALCKYRSYIKKIYYDGIPNIIMQSAYTLYILGLNLILARFSDQAVTALGLYYKWQTFFFIPLGGLQTCIVPILSYNYAADAIERCKKVLWTAIAFGLSFMMIGVICFECIPTQMLQVFSNDADVILIGTWGFRFIGMSFLPMVTSLIFPVYFQALGYGVKNIILTIIRTICLFVPVGYVLSLLGLDYFWMTFPITEILTSMVGFIFYRQFVKEHSSCHSMQKKNVVVRE